MTLVLNVNKTQEECRSIGERLAKKKLIGSFFTQSCSEYNYFDISYPQCHILTLITKALLYRQIEEDCIKLHNAIHIYSLPLTHSDLNFITLLKKQTQNI
jgi:hypothetical protein